MSELVAYFVLGSAAVAVVLRLFFKVWQRRDPEGVRATCQRLGGQLLLLLAHAGFCMFLVAAIRSKPGIGGLLYIVMATFSARYALLFGVEDALERRARARALMEGGSLPREPIDPGAR